MASITQLDSVVAAIEDLRAFFPDKHIISTDANDLISYSGSAYSQFAISPHSVIVRALSTEDIVEVVKISRKHLVPIVVRSGGTGLEGTQNAAPSDRGSICIDMSHMNNILSINENDGDVVVQPGVVWNVLNDTLKQKGVPLFFPLDPALGATIGGMINMGCSGTNAVRYGTARGEWILNVTVVLPSGEVIKTRRRSRKSSAGLDMTKLFVGSEGTLGIITEATLRLAPLLPTTVGVVGFPDVYKASQAVCEILNRGGILQCAELIDTLVVQFMNDYGKLNLAMNDSVLFKYQGSKAVMADSARLVKEVSEKYGAVGFAYYDDEEVSGTIWNMRKLALPGLLKQYPKHKGIITDVCVPLSSLPELVISVKNEVVSQNMLAPLGGHIGDGNFHALLLYQDEDEHQRAKKILDGMIKKALELDGTCTGEHGVGLSKKRYLKEELGEGTVALMCTIKQTMDPYNLFNPGKLYPGLEDEDDDI